MSRHRPSEGHDADHRPALPAQEEVSSQTVGSLSGGACQYISRQSHEQIAPPETAREQARPVPWADIVGLRNRLIHGYDSVDPDMLWDILEGDLPPLVEQLGKLLADQRRVTSRTTPFCGTAQARPFTPRPSAPSPRSAPTPPLPPGPCPRRDVARQQRQRDPVLQLLPDEALQGPRPVGRVAALVGQVVEGLKSTVRPWPSVSLLSSRI